MHARWSVRARLPRTCVGNGGGAVVSDRKRRGERACIESSTDEDPEIIRGNRGGGAVVSDRIPEIIRGNRKQLVETQSQSEPIRAHQSQLEPIRANQSQLEPIRANYSQSEPIRAN